MAKRKITQLDLFSGIGGFHLGFERSGYEVESYFSEIDKHAVAVYKHRFKNSTYVGSVTDIQGGDLPTIDLITFGSPCQDFSLAGKRKGMEGERSSLILEAIRLINECRPRAFVWENVKGTFSSNDGQDFAAILQAFTNIGGYRLEWQLLNTSWFLPQNRERIYLVGYSTTPGGDWRGVFPIGEGNGENDSKLKIYGDTNKGGERGVIYDTTGIAGCLSATDYKQPKQIAVKSATSKGYEVATEGDSINLSQPNSETRRGRVGKGKAQTLETSCNQAVVEPMIAAQRGRYQEDGSIKQELEINKEGKSNTLTAVQKDNMVVEPNYRIVKQKVWVRKHEVDIEGLQNLLRSHKSKTNKEIADALDQPITKVEHWFRKDKAGFSIPDAELWNDLKELLGITTTKYDAQVTEFVEQDGKYDQAERVYNTQGVAPTLTLAQEVKIEDTPNYRIRRLTPIECERLQGFPDNHTEYGNYDGEVKKMSNTQRYKQCGNAVTVDIVALVAEAVKPLFK